MKTVVNSIMASILPDLPSPQSLEILASNFLVIVVT